MSIPAKQKRRGRPPTGKTPMIGLRAGPDLLQSIDAYAGAENLSRSEAMRHILTDWLRDRGYLPKGA